MNPHDEACIAGAFLDFLEKGYIYRGLKPVYWCIYDRTALAEAEVEYEDHTSHVGLGEVCRWSKTKNPPSSAQASAA